MNQSNQIVRWNDYRKDNPKVRIREAASRLGVSEAELLATEIGESVVRLVPEWLSILNALPSIGRVKTITRNESCVLERTGVYADLELNAHGGTAVGVLDLRFFLGAWRRAFAVTEGERGEERRSLQFFDAYGDSVHKVYLEPESTLAAWEAIVTGHRHADQSRHEIVEARPSPKSDRPDDSVDVEGLRAAWDAMQDTHEFFPMLRKLEVGRLQALRLAGGTRAQRVAVDLEAHWREIARAGTPIMIFVGNRGLIQIHTGSIHKIVATGPWLNILDPELNVHLKWERVAETWVVRKPTKDGVVTSLELYDATGENIALLFGERKPGRPELETWRAHVATLPVVRA